MDFPTASQELKYYESLKPVENRDYAIDIFFKIEKTKYIPVFFLGGILNEYCSRAITSITKQKVKDTKNIYFVHDNNYIKAYQYEKLVLKIQSILQ